MVKVAFERYFLRKVRNGSSEPGYERSVMKTLGAGVAGKPGLPQNSLHR
jgi:hypothetical protein